MTRTPIESFLELTRKSGLIDAQRLNLYLEKLAEAQGIPEDPKELAALMVRDAVLSKFQSEQLISGKWRGFYVGKYRVLERIGIGGMGQVYLAEHRTMKRRYAIKVLPRSKAADPAALERFEREARAGGSIDHPNIVRAYDKDQDGDLHYLVMDFVDGCSLSEIVRATGPLDVTRAGNYMYQSALGLKHAHESGLIHRDVKPANILIDRQGVAKILDMGLARFFNDQNDMITKKYDETVLGTADYLSPEQAIDSHNVDIRSDFYSFGCTYYYTLTGKPPFDEGSVAQKLIWHQTRTPKSAKEHRPDIPEDLVAVLNRCMMKQADDRYATPDELLQALTGYADFNFPPTPAELPELSAIARGVAFGGDVLANVQLPGGPAASTPEPLTKDPDSKSPIFDSQLAKRGGEDSTVSIRSEESGEHKAMPPVPPSAPTQPVMISPAKSAGIAPRTSSNPPVIVDPVSPPIQQSTWDPVPSPFSAQAPVAVKVEALPATELPSRIQRKRQAQQQGVTTLPPWVWWALGVALASTIGVAIYLFVFSKPGGTGQPAPPTAPSGFTSPDPGKEAGALLPTAGPRTWHVAQTKLEGVDCTSINEAIGKAGPGDSIVITDQQIYQEALTLTPRSSKRGFGGIALRAEINQEGKRAKLMPPAAHSTGQPLISIENVDRLTISGLLVDGDGRTQNLMEIKGKCSRLFLDDLRLEGFQATGILVNQLDTTGRQEAAFTRVWIRPRRPQNQPAQSAISLQGSSCNGLQIRNSRLEGPYLAAIRIAAPLQRFLMEHCKLYAGLGQGMCWTDALTPDSRLALIIQQNTFWNFESGLLFQAPLKAEDIQIVIRNNVFYQVKNVLQVDQEKAKIKPESLTRGITGGGNIYEQGTCQPGDGSRVPRFGLKPVAFTLNTGSISPQEFLSYPSNSPLQTAGEQQDPIGAIIK